MKPLLGCQQCGACCIANDFDDTEYVSLNTREALRFPKRHVRVDPQGYLALTTRKRLLYVVNRVDEKLAQARCCVYLRGTVGGSVRCSVYEDRPRVCSSFRRGSDECYAARQQADLA